MLPSEAKYIIHPGVSALTVQTWMEGDTTRYEGEEREKDAELTSNENSALKVTKHFWLG